MMEPILFIVLISVMGPIIGSAIGVIKKPSDVFTYNMLAFAAGIMLSISFLELIPESIALSSVWICVIGIILGALVIYLLDKFIPHIHPELCCQEQGKNLKKSSLFLILGIFLHNFPEGIAIAAGAASDISVSIVVALAIAVHNIPEGICTSAPYFKETKNRLKAFLVSSTTAIPVLAGFALAYYVFTSISLNVLGLLVGATAGIMIYLSGDELIPSSCCKVTDHSTIFSLMAGVIFVVILGLI
jgi:zinc transporter, ZIP family